MSIELERRSVLFKNRFRRWFLEGISQTQKAAPTHQDAWWKVMCLTGVDYFSTLGYQPGIAFLAAGILSPIATSIVVLVTLFGLVPLYFRVAKESPHGQGSITMLQNLLPGWRGKTLVLILLGFATTGFIITITLSAADATAHIVENPILTALEGQEVNITLVMIAILGAVFLKGFREAIGFSFFIVAFYLFCNVVVISVALNEIVKHPTAVTNWQNNLFREFHSIPQMIGISLILFPKLALGMSGFETGVAVMPLVSGDKDDNPENPVGRIKNTRKLLLTAALIMALFLLTSGVVTTVLIPPEFFKEGGPANGRALAYLAHQYLGENIASIYDISTILILWFAGASAIAGLLNLLPKYLPKYGMAPNWARAQRPLVLFIMFVCFAVTISFKANVDAQAGAYATGILVLFTSAALAVYLVSKNEGWHKHIFFVILLMFIYTSVANMIERPEGLQISSFFIVSILFTSLLSRVLRSLELRSDIVILEPEAKQIIEESVTKTGNICLLAHRPGGTDYATKEAETREIHRLTSGEADFIFLEVGLSDPSDFTDDCLNVSGSIVDGFKILKCSSPAIPNAIASLLLHLRDTTNVIPKAYFGWTEGHPLAYVFKYIFLGEGETAPVTREVLRKVEHDTKKRPKIIVG